jgi:hypothetical protein
MAGTVKDYSIPEVVGSKPNLLHGIQPAKMLLIQCSDGAGKPMVLIGLEVRKGDIRVFPQDTWEKLGRPSTWLMEQINKNYYKEAEEEEVVTKVAKPKPILTDIPKLTVTEVELL